MSSINQIVSEIANSVQGTDNVPTRKAITRAVIHARNELIRHSFENHKYVDKIFQQRFRVEVIDVPDGDVYQSNDLRLRNIKRTKNKVPRPVRLTNNLPFHSVRTSGFYNPIELAFVKEASSRFYKSLPGMECAVTYDYINGYIYIDITKNDKLNNISYITIESAFELPEVIPEEIVDDYKDFNGNNESYYNDEWLISEDMVNSIKKLVLETFNVNVVRQTNEVTSNNLTP